MVPRTLGEGHAGGPVAEGGGRRGADRGCAANGREMPLQIVDVCASSGVILPSKTRQTPRRSRGSSGRRGHRWGCGEGGTGEVTVPCALEEGRVGGGGGAFVEDELNVVVLRNAVFPPSSGDTWKTAGRSCAIFPPGRRASPGCQRAARLPRGGANWDPPTSPARVRLSRGQTHNVSPNL